MIFRCAIYVFWLVVFGELFNHNICIFLWFTESKDTLSKPMYSNFNKGFVTYLTIVNLFNELTIVCVLMLQLSSTHLSHLIPNASPEAIDLISVSASPFMFDT